MKMEIPVRTIMKRSEGRPMRRTIFSVIAVFLMFAPSIAGAEWFLEPYAGLAFTSQSDVDVSASGGGTALSGKFRDVDYDDSLTTGIRVGRWLESVEYLGFALDIFGFRPDIKTQTAAFSGAGSAANDVRKKAWASRPPELRPALGRPSLFKPSRARGYLH